jgi:hypothetical protein
MNHNHVENYLRDLCTLVIEKATEAKITKTQDGDAYNIGYLMAWHEIVSLMQSQAKLFDIPFSSLGLDAIEPVRDLL